MILKKPGMAFRRSHWPVAAVLSLAAGLVTGVGLADDDDSHSSASSRWHREPDGQTGPGLRVTCELRRAGPAAPTGPTRLVFEPVGVVRLPPGDEQYGPWSIGTVYTDRDGRRLETLDASAEWFPPDKLRCELKFGGRFEPRYRAVFECGRDSGSLFEEGRLVASLENCRSEEVPDLPYHVPVGTPRAPQG